MKSEQNEGDTEDSGFEPPAKKTNTKPAAGRRSRKPKQQEPGAGEDNDEGTAESAYD